MDAGNYFHAIPESTDSGQRKRLNIMFAPVAMATKSNLPTERRLLSPEGQAHQCTAQCSTNFDANVCTSVGFAKLILQFPMGFSIFHKSRLTGHFIGDFRNNYQTMAEICVVEITTS